MANPEHIEILKQGVEAWNNWRKAHPDVRPKFGGSDLSKAILGRANLSGAYLVKADLQGANLSEANLRGANLSHSKLREADLSYADLSYTDLSDTNLASADLSNADFTEADLRRAIVVGANLSYAKLMKANLADADFAEADLREADLSNGHMSNINLTRADLREADLSGAFLVEAILREADLGSVNMREAKCNGTSFSDLDLSPVEGLETIQHYGPSHIDTHTFVKSKGKIPEVFLRGCGVPEEFITYMPSLIGGSAIQFYSCFISYSHADKAFARRIHDTLQGRGIRCWLDEHQMLPGHDIFKEVDRGIRLWDKVLLCASKNSLTSWWVDHELATIFDKERQLQREHGDMIGALIPLDLDGYLFTDTCTTPKKTQIQSRLAANFQGWDGAGGTAIFDREIERVIKALRTDEGREPPPPPKLGK